MTSCLTAAYVGIADGLDIEKGTVQTFMVYMFFFIRNLGLGLISYFFPILFLIQNFYWILEESLLSFLIFGPGFNLIYSFEHSCE